MSKKFVTKQDLINVNQIISMEIYLNNTSQKIQGKNLICPICGSNATFNDKQFCCYGKCSKKGNVVDLHQWINNFNNVYDALRDLMDQYGIDSISDPKEKTRELNGMADVNEFKEKSIKAFEQIHVKAISIHNKAIVESIKADAIGIAFDTYDIIDNLKKAVIISEQEKNDYRLLYKGMISALKIAENMI